MNNEPIGIFDSGIGGLTVLKEIIKKLPNEKYIYYADIKNVPYGTKPKEMVIQYIKEAIDFLISKNVKAIVVACNTATSIAINYLRNEYKDIPIIGIEPAAKPAIEQKGNKKVLIMATPITIREEKLKRLLELIDEDKSVDLIPMPRLVEFAEKFEFDSEEVTKYIKEQLKDYNLNEYSELVLGCTHFPLFKKVLSEIFPKNVQIIDGSIGVAKRLFNILQEKDMIGKRNLEIEYYCSGKLSKNKKKFNEILYIA